jgi:hypothetical protein
MITKKQIYGGFYQSNEHRSQFWKGLHKVKQWLKMGSSYDVGNDRKTFFWTDVLLGKCPLKTLFLAIYECCEQKNDTVAEVLRENSVHLTFSRSFGPSHESEWGKLLVAIAGVSLSERDNVISWDLGKNRNFTSKSMYEFILNPGVWDLRLSDMWGG